VRGRASDRARSLRWRLVRRYDAVARDPLGGESAPAIEHARGPKVSVVIPTYGHRNYILDALTSVFEQSYTDREVIVVNDGSPRDTGSLLAPLVGTGRIRDIEQPNRGLAAARNPGLEAARGEYIALLDDDDIWPTDKLQWQVAELDAHREAVAVGPAVDSRAGQPCPRADFRGSAGAPERS
jgi:glycosyltransferase involved in cell wall biosynthesis